MMAEPAPIGARIASDDARPVRPEWRPKR
jgi:hypothetical protein